MGLGQVMDNKENEHYCLKNVTWLHIDEHDFSWRAHNSLSKINKQIACGNSPKARPSQVTNSMSTLDRGRI